MYPINEMSPMSSPKLPPNIPNGQMLVGLLLIMRSFLVKKVVCQHDHRPETDDGSGRHQLILVQTKKLFGVSKKHLYIPAGGNVPYQRHQITVEAPHELYVDESGNPDGIPVLFVHGGPGAGCGKYDRRFFDPEVHSIVSPQSPLDPSSDTHRP